MKCTKRERKAPFPQNALKTAPQRLVKLPQNVPTGSDDFLLGDVSGMDLAGEFQHRRVGVFVGVRINVGLQRLQLVWSKENLMSISDEGRL